MSVTVAIIDSGVNPAHPHIGNIAGGIEIRPTGTSEHFLDFLGHGTAVAAAIHEKAPEAQLYIIKVFHRSLSTTIDQLLRALDHAIDLRAPLVNLSLGTHNEQHRARFQPVVERAVAYGVRIVSAAGALPGLMDGVTAVSVDEALPRDQVRFDSNSTLFASPLPRPIPGLPEERNLHGISFAVANATGILARASS